MHRPGERSHADAVAGAREALAVPIPDREGPLPVHALHAALAPDRVGVQDRLGVRARREAPAMLRFELFAQLEMVEDLAVEGDHELPVGGRHRLGAPREAQDREARVRQPAGAVDLDPAPVRAAVAQIADHPPEQSPGRGAAAEVQDSCDSTHNRVAVPHGNASYSRPARNSPRTHPWIRQGPPQAGGHQPKCHLVGWSRPGAVECRVDPRRNAQHLRGAS